MRWLNEPTTSEELIEMRQLKFVPVTIERLEKRNLTIKEQRRLVEEVDKLLVLT